MLTQPTVDHMNAMKMFFMVEALQRQLATSQSAALSFEERLGMLIDAEWSGREQRKLNQRLRTARLRHPASLEDVDFKAPRGLNRELVLSLGRCDWIRERQNLILTGPTGVGKSYLACAFAERACRSGFTAHGPAGPGSRPITCVPRACIRIWRWPAATGPTASSSPGSPALIF